MNSHNRDYRTELKPCPRCGKDSGRRMVTTTAIEQYVVRCDSCGFTTPKRNTKSAATRIWNSGKMPPLKGE